MQNVHSSGDKNKTSQSDDYLIWIKLCPTELEEDSGYFPLLI